MKVCMKKIIVLSLLITVPFFIKASVHQPNQTYTSENQELLLPGADDTNNEFDTMADAMVERGMVVEQPKQLSKTTIFIRKVGGALFMKYLAVKNWFKNAWAWLFRRKTKTHASNNVS